MCTLCGLTAPYQSNPPNNPSARFAYERTLHEMAIIIIIKLRVDIHIYIYPLAYYSDAAPFSVQAPPSPPPSFLPPMSSRPTSRSLSSFTMVYREMRAKLLPPILVYQRCL